MSQLWLITSQLLHQLLDLHLIWAFHLHVLPMLMTGSPDRCKNDQLLFIPIAHIWGINVVSFLHDLALVIYASFFFIFKLIYMSYSKYSTIRCHNHQDIIMILLLIREIIVIHPKTGLGSRDQPKESQSYTFTPSYLHYNNLLRILADDI